jgi:hypothetical protein
MDNSERLAEEYFRSLGVDDIRFEPDGNVPPDFLLSGQIAVEVRRLNQNFEGTNQSARGLEEDRIPITVWLDKFLRNLKFGEPHRRTWFVGCDFSRPLPPLRELKTQLRVELTSLLKRVFEGNVEEWISVKLNVGCNFRVDVFAASDLHMSAFIPAGCNDMDSGGWLLPELNRNLNICIHEKSQKIREFKSRYSHWWLVLEDQIAFGLSIDDRNYFKENFNINPMEFNKIIIIFRNNILSSWELI